MAYQQPSVQSFYHPESPIHKSAKHDSSPAADGFTAREIGTVLNPVLHKWHPRCKYADKDIGALIPGPGCVALMGRVVNFYDQATPSKMPHAAKGCLKVIVKDDTGAIVVRLWYAKVDYELRLGHLVIIWTPHISNAESSSMTLKNASLVTSVFPERDNSCYFLVQEQSDDGMLCKTPIGYKDGKQLGGLMTLKNFVEGGYEVIEGKILVCVKSIGGRKKFTTKKGVPAEKVDVNVFDDTFEATLTLWNRATASANAWKPSFTILLISNPDFRSERRAIISINATTHVDVDPDIRDAAWLREFAQRLTKKEHVNQPYPQDVFDVEETAGSEIRILFTLADIDEFVRAAPHGGSQCAQFDLAETDLSRREIHGLPQRHDPRYEYYATIPTQHALLHRMYSCGVPMYANATITKCKQCEKNISLRLNPRLVGTLIDETGSIGCGKLVWSDHAWEQLLGRNAGELVSSSTQLLKYMEHRLLFLRVSLMFGWSEELGKLAICQVKM